MKDSTIATILSLLTAACLGACAGAAPPEPTADPPEAPAPVATYPAPPSPAPLSSPPPAPPPVAPADALAPVVAAANPVDEEPSMRDLVQRVYDSRDPDQAIELIIKALKLDERTHELTEPQRRTLRGALFGKLQNSFKAVTSGNSEAALAAWYVTKEKLVPPYLPATKDFASRDYDGTLDFAPLFLVTLGYAHCAKSEYAECRLFLEQARGYRNVAFKDRTIKRLYVEFLGKTDKALAGSDPYAPGAYLMNAGFFQTWIGRIVERRGSVVKVRLTYVYAGGNLPGKRGEVVEFALGHVKPLTAVSADALLKGYQ